MKGVIVSVDVSPELYPLLVQVDTPSVNQHVRYECAHTCCADSYMLPDLDASQSCMLRGHRFKEGLLRKKACKGKCHAQNLSAHSLSVHWFLCKAPKAQAAQLPVTLDLDLNLGQNWRKLRSRSRLDCQALCSYAV